MLYTAYETQRMMTAPARELARWALATMGQTPFEGRQFWREMAATLALVERVGLTHTSPAFGIDSVRVGNRDVAVREEETFATPFGSLRHFAKDTGVAQPRVLVVAPLSGHFATLLRHTVRTLLGDHDVTITDWHNARDVPLEAGRFGFDDYVLHLVRFLKAMGGETHVVAVCHPCVQVLGAAALMAQAGDPTPPAA